ncbi:hypothetical protein N9Y67_00210 [Pseudomonadota bacterium]|nr:hypothetical protein [Pseudomonadota bacterium]
MTINPFAWYRKLDSERQGVIVEMIFNMGLPTFLEFKRMIQALRGNDFDAAASEMLDSLWSKQVGIRSETLAKYSEKRGYKLKRQRPFYPLR